MEQVNIESELDYFQYKRDSVAGITLRYKMIHPNNSSFDVDGYSRVKSSDKGQEG